MGILLEGIGCLLYTSPSGLPPEVFPSAPTNGDHRKRETGTYIKCKGKLRSDSLDACTRGGLYCSAEPLPMGFTLPHTRLAFKRLRPLSCQRLGPPATLTTWVSLLYLRLTDPLELQDAILT
ncbi:hypothetical protein DEO72_LG2g4211 [Vigna unguiculata]|uniref:Uncharacterized protein n=1 Tax=Vigna unguiculata TaxID=3917 RepID=A0A4D6L5S9_VIGUN|nr:hypothetical protein DEO72_LG2g4211 [Vigna unguiculata]